MTTPRRVLLKLSGEALMGARQFGIEPDVLRLIAHQVGRAGNEGVEVAIVVGGGNMWRGSTVAETGMDRATADYAGMLATIMNGLALQDALERAGLDVRTQSALPISAVAEPYIRRRAIRHLEKGRIVIFAGGTGNPFMTTDTAAALRAVEIEAQSLLMAKNGVDGVYDGDPKEKPNARRYASLTHLEAIQNQLKVMDGTALSLCMEHDLPIVVFDVGAPDGIYSALVDHPIGTIVASRVPTEPVQADESAGRGREATYG